jgi:hypothetical protein
MKQLVQAGRLVLDGGLYSLPDAEDTVFSGLQRFMENRDASMGVALRSFLLTGASFARF